MDNYQQTLDKLNGRNKRKIDNNTYLELHEDKSVTVRLHVTNILTFYPDNRVIYATGGWRTVTTKARLTQYGPVNIWTDKGVWYVACQRGNWDKLQTFEEGMCYQDGTLTGTGIPPKNLTKEKRKIAEYAKDFCEALAQGKVEAPSLGDCFYCGMRTESKQPLGEATQDHNHMHLHIEEKYYVPSLAYRAVELFANSTVAKDVLYRATHGDSVTMVAGHWTEIGLEQIRKAIRRYVSKQLGYQA